MDRWLASGLSERGSLRSKTIHEIHEPLSFVRSRVISGIVLVRSGKRREPEPGITLH
jgi:hypothetical protein